MSQREALSFLSASSPEYIADLYDRYSKNPDSVDASWAELFGSLGVDASALLGDLKGASWRPAPEKIAAVLSTAANAEAPPKEIRKDVVGKKVAALPPQEGAADSLKAFLLIRAYQVRGHLQADLDPLNLMERKYHPELDPKTYGFTEADMDRPIMLGGLLGFESATLRKIMDVLNETYCGTIGVEFMHIQDPEQKQWLMSRFRQTRNRPAYEKSQKVHFLKRLTSAEGFEKFLDTKFTGTKRFGLEGGEATVLAIEEFIGKSAQLGLKEAVLGMAHRGRLNVLTNVMGKSFTAMFSEFQGTPAKPDDVQGSGDVKYHLGTSSDRDFGGNVVHLSLTPNPSDPGPGEGVAVTARWSCSIRFR